MGQRIDSIVAGYRTRRMNRRVFFERLIAIAGSYPLAHRLRATTGWAASLRSSDASQDIAVETLPVKYPGEGATLTGYLTRPKGRGPFPAVIVIHENTGLNDAIRDVARRLAAEDFTVLAVDQLSRQGGTASFATLAEATRAIDNLRDDQIVADLDAAFRYLHSGSLALGDRIGAMGFGWGGQRTLLYAAVNPGPQAAVVFNRGIAPQETLRDIPCPVLAHYGETAPRIRACLPESKELMKNYNHRFDADTDPGTAYAFFKDTGRNYHEAAAKDAWARTLTFLHKTLRYGPSPALRRS